MRRSGLVLALVVAGSAAPLPVRAAEPDWCAPPPGLTAITEPQDHTAARVTTGEKVSIVAVGSSSTVGVGSSGPGLDYPSRLEADLHLRFPTVDIRVINRGKSGEDAPEELARLDSDVVALHPDLAIWQVGTNAVLRRDGFDTDGDWMRQGVALLKHN